METMMIATSKVKAIMYSIGFTPFRRGFNNRPHYLPNACPWISPQGNYTSYIGDCQYILRQTIDFTGVF